MLRKEVAQHWFDWILELSEHAVMIVTATGAMLTYVTLLRLDWVIKFGKKRLLSLQHDWGSTPGRTVDLVPRRRCISVRVVMDRVLAVVHYVPLAHPGTHDGGVEFRILGLFNI